MWQYNYSPELYHYGVMGMKWGVRKYQDKNGNLTEAGKKKYGYDKESGQYIKKSFTTRGFEKLANKTGDTQNKQTAKESFRLDTIKQTKGRKVYKTAKMLSVNAADYQSNINQNKKVAENYKKNIEDIKKNGYKTLINNGYSEKSAKAAVNMVLNQRKTYLDSGVRMMKKQEETLKSIKKIDPTKVSYKKAKKLVRELNEANRLFQQTLVADYQNNSRIQAYSDSGGRYTTLRVR